MEKNQRVGEDEVCVFLIKTKKKQKKEEKRLQPPPQSVLHQITSCTAAILIDLSCQQTMLADNI